MVYELADSNPAGAQRIAARHSASIADSPSAFARNSAHGLAFLDVLRATAALMVFVYHCAERFLEPVKPAYFPSLAQGQAGVALFFSLSGYLIFATLERSYSDSSGGPPRSWYVSFWIRRFCRIYPLYLFSLAAVLALSPEWRTTYHIPYMVAHLFGMHSFTRSWHGAFNGVLWSLAIEIQFYVIAPFVYLAVRRLSVGRLALAAILLWIGSYGFIRYGLIERLHFWTIDSTPDNWSYFIGLNQLPSCMLMFALGFLGYRLRKVALPWWSLGLAGAIFFLLPYLPRLLHLQGGSEVLMAYLRHAGYCVCFLPFIIKATSFRGEKDVWVRLMQWVSSLSYSFYIWHLLIINLVQVHFGEHSVWFKSLVSLACTLIFSDFTARYIEKPGIELGKRLISRYIDTARALQ